MFRVKKKGTEDIYVVLDVFFDPILHTTHFLIWDNGGWRWRNSVNYVPPNWKEEKKN